MFMYSSIKSSNMQVAWWNLGSSCFSPVHNKCSWERCLYRWVQCEGFSQQECTWNAGISSKLTEWISVALHLYTAVSALKEVACLVSLPAVS